MYWTVNGQSRYLKADWTGDSHAKQIRVELCSVGNADGSTFHNVSDGYTNFSNTAGWQDIGTGTSGASVIGPFTPKMGNDLKYYVYANIREAAETRISNSTTKIFGLRGVPPLQTDGTTNITPISEVGQSNCKICINLTNFRWDDNSRVALWTNISDGATQTNIKVAGNLDCYNYSNQWYSSNYDPKSQSSWFTAVCWAINEQATSLNAYTYRYSYTYTHPSISNFTISSNHTDNMYNFSPQDNPIMYLNVNGRRWNLESNFNTTLTLTNSNNMTSSTNILSWFGFNSSNLAYVNTTDISNVDKIGYGFSLTAKSLSTDTVMNVQNVFNATVRSNSFVTSTATLNVSHPNMVGIYKSAISTKTFRVQYQPTQSPANDTVTDGINDVQGKTVAIHKVPTITVGWTYNHYAGAAGVVNGYKVVIMDDTKTQIKQTKYYSKTALSSPVSITLNTATELFIGKMNYARVTPYYFKPNQSGTVTDDTKIILGTQSYDIKLVKPYYKMNAPVIQYPINNTIWHNKDFRILCTMPEDPNFEGYTQAQQNNYQYGNIQVEISTDDNTLKLYDYTNVWTGATNSYEDCFSSLLSDYKQNKAIWLNRTDGDVITSGTYKIRMRAQMPNYIFTNEEMRDNSDDSPAWSDWSNTVNITVVAVNKQNLVKGNKIYASEYATVQDYIKRLLRCYPIGQDVTVSVNVGDIIYRNEYTSIYNTITNLITGVNSYCTFTNNGTEDRRDIQLAYGTKALPSFTALQEIILAAETGVDDNGSTGRNYKNILTGYMIDCLK